MENLDFSIKDQFELSFSANCEEIASIGLTKLTLYPDHPNGFSHTINILQHLKKIKEEGRIALSDSSCEILILSAIWHDFWKLEHSGAFFQLCGLFFEGPFSAKIFQKTAAKSGYDQLLTNKIIYVIKEHGGFIFHRKSLESKIFHDLDQLDETRPERQRQIWHSSSFLIRLLHLVQNYLPKYYYFSEIKRLKK